jgi:hypothetical protein
LEKTGTDIVSITGTIATRMRTEMTKEAVEQIWNAYLKAYGNVSTEERRRLLWESVSSDVRSINPAEETQGFEGLLAHVEEFQHRLPGAYFKINKLLFHHEEVLAEWTLYKSDETPLRTAYTHGLFNDQGRLKKLVGFF